MGLEFSIVHYPTSEHTRHWRSWTPVTNQTRTRTELEHDRVVEGTCVVRG